MGIGALVVMLLGVLFLFMVPAVISLESIRFAVRSGSPTARRLHIGLGLLMLLAYAWAWGAAGRSALAICAPAAVALGHLAASPMFRARRPQ